MTEPFVRFTKSRRSLYSQGGRWGSSNSGDATLARHLTTQRIPRPSKHARGHLLSPLSSTCERFGTVSGSHRRGDTCCCDVPRDSCSIHAVSKRSHRGCGELPDTRRDANILDPCAGGSSSRLAREIVRIVLDSWELLADFALPLHFLLGVGKGTNWRSSSFLFAAKG